MKTNSPHKSLRSNWQSQAYTSPKTKGVIIINRSIGRNQAQPIVKMQGAFLPSNARGGYLY